MNSPIIRRAKETDLPQVLDLWVELMDFHSRLDPHFSMAPNARDISLPHLHNRMSSSESAVFVAETEKSILGYCIACIREKPPVFVDRRHGFISDIFVSGSARGIGIGENLFLEAKQWLEGQGILRIELRTISINDVSNHFWKRLGFENFAEEKVLNLKEV